MIMASSTWLAFCALELILCLTPGPAVLVTSGAALANGLRAGLRAALGVVVANCLFFALAATGLSAVILTSNVLFASLKWAGAAYLVWQGTRMLRRSGAPDKQTKPGIGRDFLRGIAVQAGNPKALVFFIALLPQFVDPRSPLGLQLLVLATTSALIELGVLAMYAGLSSRARRIGSRRWSTRLERVGGGLLIALGVRLIFDDHGLGG